MRRGWNRNASWTLVSRVILKLIKARLKGFEALRQSTYRTAGGLSGLRLMFCLRMSMALLDSTAPEPVVKPFVSALSACPCLCLCSEHLSVGVLIVKCSSRRC